MQDFLLISPNTLDNERREREQRMLASLSPDSFQSPLPKSACLTSPPSVSRNRCRVERSDLCSANGEILSQFLIPTLDPNEMIQEKDISMKIQLKQRPYRRIMENPMEGMSTPTTASGSTKSPPHRHEIAEKLPSSRRLSLEMTRQTRIMKRRNSGNALAA